MKKELEEKNTKHIFSRYKMHFFLLDLSNFQISYLSHFLLNFSDLKCYGTPPYVLQISWEL
jgi:hypothetical protein